MRVRNIGRDSERQKERFWKSMYMGTKRTTRELEYSDKSNNTIASINSIKSMPMGAKRTAREIYSDKSNNAIASIQSKVCTWEKRGQLERLNIQIRVTMPLQAFNQMHACI